MKSTFTIFLILISIKVSAQTITTKDTTTKLTTEFKNKIISESKDGRKFDFWTPIKGHEFDGAMIAKSSTFTEDIYASKREVALIKWVISLKKQGIKRNDIISLYEALKGRKITNEEISLVDTGIKDSTD